VVGPQAATPAADDEPDLLGGVVDDGAGLEEVAAAEPRDDDIGPDDAEALPEEERGAP
jgi:hypothetical protein